MNELEVVGRNARGYRTVYQRHSLIQRDLMLASMSTAAKVRDSCHGNEALRRKDGRSRDRRPLKSSENYQFLAGKASACIRVCGAYIYKVQ